MNSLVKRGSSRSSWMAYIINIFSNSKVYIWKSGHQLIQPSSQLLQQLQLLALMVLLRTQLRALLLQCCAKKRRQLLHRLASQEVQRRSCLSGTNIQYFLRGSRITCLVRNTPMQPSTWVALSSPFTKFSSILKRFCSTRRYPSFFSYSSQGQSAGGHSGRQYHHRTATSLTKLSLGSSSSTFTRSTFCRGCRTSSLSSTLLSFFCFFQCFRFGRDYDSSDCDSSYESYPSDYSLSLSCLRLYDSSLALNQGYAFLIFFSTRLKLSPYSESSISMVSGFSYFCCCQSLRLFSYYALRASSSFLRRFYSFLCLISSRRACSSASSRASSSLSRLSLFVLRLLTTTCMSRELPLPNRSSPISDSNQQQRISQPPKDTLPTKIRTTMLTVTSSLQLFINSIRVESIIHFTMSSVNAETLLIIKQCSDTASLSDQQIRAAFKQYAIGRIAKFQERDEIVIEFTSQEQMELLDMEFEEGKVPLLGPNAYYDVSTPADPQQFLERYQMSTIKSEAETTTKQHQEIQKLESLAQEQRKKEEDKTKQEQASKKKEQDERQSEQKLERQIEEEKRVQRQQEQKKKEEERIRKGQEQKEREERDRQEKERQRQWVQQQKKEAQERERQLNRKAQEEREKEAQWKLQAEEERRRNEQQVIKKKIEKEKQEQQAKKQQIQRHKQEQEERIKRQQAQEQDKRRSQLEGIQKQTQMAETEERFKKQQEEQRLAEERRLKAIEQEKKKAEAIAEQLVQAEEKRRKQQEEAQKRLREAQVQDEKRKVAELQRISEQEQKKRREVQELKQKELQIQKQKEVDDKLRRDSEELKKKQLQELQDKKSEMQTEHQNFQQIQEKLQHLKKSIEQTIPEQKQIKKSSSMLPFSFITMILAGWLYYVYLR